MAIEFVQEDGTGLSNATSYASIAQFRQYWENRGVDYSTKSDAQVKGYLNAATEYIDMNYKFKSSQKVTTQALEWPRLDVYDQNCILVTGAPVEVINATCFMAAQVINGQLNQVETNVRSESAGPVSVSYGGNPSKSYPAAAKMLRFYTIPSGTLMRVN